MNQLPRLEQVLKAQKLAADKIKRAAKVDRAIPEVNDEDQLTVVYGLRGVGKTWWAIDHCSKQGVVAYVDAEDESLKQMKGLTAADILEAVVMLYGDCRMVIIDEFKKLAIWGEVIEVFISSGWRVIALNSGDKPGITTREVMINPMSWPQYCSWHGVAEDMATPTGRGLLRKAFDDYLIRGGMPGMQSRRKGAVGVQALIGDIIARDTAGGIRPALVPQMQRIALRILNQSPVVLNYKELLPTTDVKSVNTLRKYVDDINTTGLFRPLVRLSMFDNVRNFMEKLYAADTGLMVEAHIGERIETAVYLHLNQYCNRNGYMMHYYGNRDRQCHFAVCRDMRMRVAVEYVPYTDDAQVMQGVMSGFMSLSRATGCGKLILLTDNNHDLMQVNGMKVEVVPVYEFLLSLSHFIDL